MIRVNNPNGARALLPTIGSLFLILATLGGCADPQPIIFTQAPPDEARARRLLASNALQEAIWEFDKLGQHDRADSLSLRLRHTLLGAPQNIERWQGSGIMTSYLLAFDNGTRGFFKVAGSDTSGPIRNELAAFAIDSLLHINITPAGAYRTLNTTDGKHLEGVVKYFVEAARTAESLGLKSPDKPDLLLFFDTVIANADRHTGNWMVRDDTKELIAIDHNRTFQFDQEWTWYRRMRTIRNPEGLGRSLRLFRTLPEAEFERAR